MLCHGQKVGWHVVNIAGHTVFFESDETSSQMNSHKHKRVLTTNLTNRTSKNEENPRNFEFSD